jgi:hypothetical protein
VTKLAPWLWRTDNVLTLHTDGAMRLRTQDLVWEEVDSEIIVLDSRSSHYFRVNGSGAVIWKMLETGATREEMISMLVSTYGIEDGRAAEDVDSFVAALRDQDMIDAE